jgi:hypothetical protein
MTVEHRQQLNFRSGWTWNAGAWKHGARRAPAYELAWDDEGHPELTGRYALMTYGEIDRTQSASPDPSRFEPDELISHERYVQLIERCAELGSPKEML